VRHYDDRYTLRAGPYLATIERVRPRRCEFAFTIGAQEIAGDGGRSSHALEELAFGDVR
jgi:hypothetical protein